MDRYGIKNCFMDTEKIKQGMLKKYGVDHNMKLQKCLDQCKKTCMKNWGVDNPSKSNEIKKKKEETCMKNHGVKSPYQNKNIFIKSMTNGTSLKIYKKSKLNYQGSYEKDFLDKYYNKINIENGITIKYNYNNKEKIYYSDFYVPEFNLIIEIKSTYWNEKHKNQNEIKKQYSKIHHNFIMILDKNYDEFNKFLIDI
jgi:hypothetical protein